MRSEPVELSGGDALRLRHWDSPQTRARVLLVHGLGGSAERPYMMRAASHFLNMGYSVSSLSMRRTCQGASRYHLGLYEDIECALHALERASRDSRLCLLGFSGGGSVVLHFLARSSDAGRVQAAACMSAPLDLPALGRHVEQNTPFYHRHLVRGLSVGAEAPYRSLRDFDERVLCGHYGFAGVEDYRVRASAGPLVGAIRTPTLLLESSDDPLVPAAMNHAYAKGASASVTRVVTAHGGHIGWVQSARELRTADSWGLRRVSTFFDAV